MSSVIESLHGKKLLFVASTGGHLSQLHRLAEKMQPAKDSLWVTFEKPQSLSLLAGTRRHFIPYISPRDYRGVWAGMRFFRALIASEQFDAVVSTGAAIALSSHLTARRAGLRAVYIESVSRFDGPSLSGRVLERVPGIERYAQHPGYPASRWSHEFSVLDTYRRDENWTAAAPLSIFVTLGTIHPYRFDRLIDRLTAIAPPDAKFVWQVGSTDRVGLPGVLHKEMSSAAFSTAAEQSDLVVTHAGVGTIMGLLDMKRPTLVVPRRKHFNEHVDDHQLQITREVARRGLAVAAEVDEIGPDTLTRAAATRVL